MHTICTTNVLTFVIVNLFKGEQIIKFSLLTKLAMLHSHSWDLNSRILYRNKNFEYLNNPTSSIHFNLNSTFFLFSCIHLNLYLSSSAYAYVYSSSSSDSYCTKGEQWPSSDPCISVSLTAAFPETITKGHPE